MKTNSVNEYTESMFDQMNKRIDNHSSRMDAGFNKVFEKLDHMKDEKFKERKEVDENIRGVAERVIVLETQKKTAFSLISKIGGLIGGVGGIYAFWDKIKHL